MRIPRKDERGFTLVELLIALAIMSGMSSIVIPNVTGMFGRGEDQAYHADKETIQAAASTFYFDVHGGDAGTDWNAAGSGGHKWPTVSGTLPTSDYTGGATAPGGADGTIWFGLLVNTPGAGADNVPAEVAPLAGEKGPYLNEFPESAHQLNTAAEYSGGSVSDSETSGNYVWLLTTSGVVTAFYYDSTEWVEAYVPADDTSDPDPDPLPSPPKKKTIIIEGPILKK